MKKLWIIIPFIVLTSFSIPKKEKRQTIEITTDYGTIRIALYNETPQHRDNILKLANSGFYDSLLFHRVIKGFMIQGGDPDSKHAKAGAMLGNGDVGYTIPAEFNEKLFHKRGVLAAAREGDDVNPEKKSSGCQFYIVQGRTYTDAELDNIEKKTGHKFSADQREAYKTIGGAAHLDGAYTVYGEVIEGMNVVDSIAAVKTDKADRPLKDIRMTIKQGKPIKVIPVN